MTTLYLTEPGSYVKKDGETLIVHLPANEAQQLAKRKVRLPLMKISQVVVYGTISLSSPVLTTLLAQGTEVCFCSNHGKFLGRLTSPLSKNSLIRLQQHQAHHDDKRSFHLARAFVRGKLSNMRAMLMRANRKRQQPDIEAAVTSIKNVIEKLDELTYTPDAPLRPNPKRPQEKSLYGTLLGLEGAGTARYFGVFGRLLKGDWGFTRRQRRPPRDPINALLSYGYVLLMNQAASAVSIVGLDPYVGYLHSSQYGKPALALDVMEAFRPLVVDSVVMTLINNGMLSPKDFIEELGAWRLTDHGRRTFLRKFEDRLNTEIKHPAFGYRASYRRSLELEVRLLAKWLTGEIPHYHCFVAR